MYEHLCSPLQCTCVHLTLKSGAQALRTELQGSLRPQIQTGRQVACTKDWKCLKTELTLEPQPTQNLWPNPTWGNCLLKQTNQLSA